jgi:hypothetical protein
MKTLNTYTPNELKDVARVNFHTIIRLLKENGFQPLMQHVHGTRTHSFYGAEAMEFVQRLRNEKDAKKADKLARKAAWAARRAAAEERRAMKGQKKEKKETPIEVIQSVQSELPFDNDPSLRELVMETNRLLQEMLDFWKK